MSNDKSNKDSAEQSSTQLTPEKRKRLEEILKGSASTLIKIPPAIIPLTTEAAGN